MKDQTKIITKLALSFLVTTLGPLSYTAVATQGSSQVKTPNLNAQLFNELKKIKEDLSKGNIRSAKDSLAKMRELSGNSPQYQDLITMARKEIEKKEGVGTKTRTPMGISAPKVPESAMKSDVSDEDIAAFDAAFLNDKSAEAQRIFNKYPKTPQDSPKKTDFLDFATSALKILRGEENAVSAPRQRTASGFTHAYVSFFEEFKKGLSNENIKSAKESLEHMKKYSNNSEEDQSAIRSVEEKINEYERKNPISRQQAVYGTKTRTPMGMAKGSAPKAPESAMKSDVSDEDIAAFNEAFVKNDRAAAEHIFNKYPKTPQDTQKKKEFLDLASMELQVMP